MNLSTLTHPAYSRLHRITLHSLIGLVVLLVSSTNLKAQNYLLEKDWWETNGSVASIVKDTLTNTIYIGGAFNAMGLKEPNGAQVDSTTAIPDFNFFNPNGTLNSVVSDGNGGWYIGGTFTQVGGVARSNVAHLSPSGLVSNFNPNINGTIYTLLRKDTTLYIGGSFSRVGNSVPNGALLDSVSAEPIADYPLFDGYVYAAIPDGNGGFYIGGSFTQVGGYARTGLAQIDAFGFVTNWDPQCNGTVQALALSGNTLYVGGGFTALGGSPRNNIGAVSTITGLATSWNPNASSGGVSAIAVGSSAIYVGGSFTSIGGQSRSRIAALNTTNGQATAWNPSANSNVNSIAVVGTTVYVGGDFTNIGGQARAYLAALNASVNTNNALSWNPNANSSVYTIVPSGSVIYAGGFFSAVGGEFRNGAAAIDAATGLANSWDPNIAGGYIYSMSLRGNTVYLAGSFNVVGGQPRNNVAAVNATTGAVTAWNGNADATTYTVSAGAERVFAGGFFSAIGPSWQNRYALVAVSTNTGKVTSWNPVFDTWATVYALANTGNTLYVGGSFSNIGSDVRQNLAAIDMQTALATAWDPYPNSTVRTLALNTNGTVIYAGGDFTSIGGFFRNYVAALNNTDGTATSWNPNANSNVYALAFSGTTVYTGGWFTNIGGQARAYIAALNNTNGNATTWNPGANSQVKCLMLRGNTLYAGGTFTSIGGSNRRYLAALNTTVNTNNALAWDPNPSATVNALAAYNSKVYVAGEFNYIGSIPRQNIAALDANTGQVKNWNPGAGDIVESLLLDGDNLYVGGWFTTLSGQPRSRVGAIDKNTGVATAWNPNANDIVFILKKLGSTIYAGGQFTQIGGQARNRIAALNNTTGAATAWDPNCDGTVYAIEPTASVIYVGGWFNNIGSANRNYIAALNPSTGTATSWNPNADNIVYDIKLKGSVLYAGGFFTSIGGASRNYGAALNTAVNTNNALNWNPNANSVIYRLGFTRDNKVIVGGNFSQVGGDNRNNLAIVDSATGTATSWNPSPSGLVRAIESHNNTIYTGGDFDYVGNDLRLRFAVYSEPFIRTSTILSPLCIGGNVSVPFIASSNFLLGNVFTVQLSDASGSFANPTVIGTLAGTQGSVINTTIPANTPPGTGYRIRVVGSIPATIGSDNGVNIEIKSLVTPTVSISANPGNVICGNTNVTFTATATNAGTNPGYQWKRNGNNVGTNSSTFSSSSLANGDVISCVITSDETCPASTNASSSNITMVVSPNVVPTCTIAANPGNSICAGVSVTFTATITGGGNNPTYQWKVNGNNVGTNSSTFTSSTLVQGDIVTCQLTSNATCPSPNPVTSAGITMTVTAAPAAPANPTSNSPQCSNVGVTITRTGAPSSGETWYWQTANNGTAMLNSGATLSVSSSGTYYLRARTNTNGCWSVGAGSVAVIVNTAPTLNPTATSTPICNSESTTINANATAGSGTISSYAWSSNSGIGNVSGGSVSPSSNTTYSVTVTNSNNCTASGSITVNVNTIPTLNPSANPTSICSGQSSTLSANASAGSGTITSYAWSSGLGNVASGSVFPTSNTTYTVTVTNSNTCTATASVSVSVTSSPVVAPTASPSAICNGQSSTLAANATAGSGTISTYAWSSNSGLSNSSGGVVSPSSNATYTVTVTNTNNCTTTATVSVTVNANPTVAPTVNPTAICNGQSTTLSANATAGSGSITTFVWSSGLGNVASGSVSPTSNTTYTVTVTNSNNCTSTGTTSVTVNAIPTAAPTASLATICNGQSTTLNANATAGSGNISSYAWSSGLGNVASGSVSPTTNTTYTVTVTNSNNCTASATTSVAVNANPTVAPTATAATICNGQSSTLAANATAGSGSISTYAWSSNTGLGNVASGSVSPTTNTNYQVTVTNSNNCTASATTSVTVNANPTVAPTVTTATICNGQSTTLNANATAGSGTISSYAWSSGLGNVASGSVSPTSNTTYNVTVTNSNNCTATGSTSVSVNAVPTVAPTASPAVICNGQSSTLAANATAGSGTISTYAWSSNTGFGNTASGSVSPTTNTNYQVTVTNSNNCTASATTSVAVNVNPIVAPTATAATICNGQSSTLAANATAGSGTISTYAWSSNTGLGNVSGGSVSPTTNTAYQVTVTNSNNCTASATTSVTVNANPTVAPTATAGIICNGQSTTLNANATAGSGTISSYAWSSGLGNVASGSVSPTTNTTYTVTVVNSNNCSASGSISVTVNALPVVAPTANPAAFCEGESTTVAANATLGGGTITNYQWSSTLGNVSGGTITPALGTQYSVTVTGSNNCTASAVVNFTVNALPATPSTPVSNSPQCSVVTLSQSGTPPTGVNWYWQTAPTGTSTANSSSTFDVTNSGTYYLRAQSSSGCWSTGAAGVTVLVFPAITLNALADTAVCAGNPVSLGNGLNATGGSGQLVYQWSPATGLDNAGIQNPTATPTTNTTYNVTVLDANGCSATSSKTITVNPNPSANAGLDQTINNGANANLGGNPTATGGTGAYSYNWSPATFLNSASISNPVADAMTVTTTYQLTVTDGVGCSATDSVTITVLTGPVISTTTTPTTCPGACDGSIALTVTGGTPPYTFEWSNGANTSTVNQLCVGEYFVTVTDDDNATATQTFLITTSGPQTPPAQPSAITGTLTNHCPGTTGLVFSINPVTGATGYYWEVDSTATIVSGQGTTSVTVNLGTPFTSAVLRVRSYNQCDSSTFRTATIRAVTATTPGNISGPSAGVCGGATGVTYSIQQVTGAVSYNWTVSVGTITSGQGTTSITVDFPAGYTTNTIRVQSINSCQVGSNFRTLTVTGTSATFPGSITGPTNEVCGGTTGVTYSVAPVSGATYYQWEVTQGTITSGQGTESITVNFPAAYTSSTVRVRAFYGTCNDTSSFKSATVRSIPATPGNITGLATPCTGDTITYSVANTAGANTYTWSVPAGWSIVSGQGTRFVDVKVGTSSGNIEVYATNTCGNGTSRKMAVDASCITGVEPVELVQSVKVYPNPFSNQFTIEFESAKAEQAIHCTLYDLSGRVVRYLPVQTVNGNNQIAVTMDTEAAGMYIVELRSANGRYHTRVVKE